MAEQVTASVSAAKPDSFPPAACFSEDAGFEASVSCDASAGSNANAGSKGKAGFAGSANLDGRPASDANAAFRENAGFDGNERGSAVVGFALTAPLLVAGFVALLGLVLALSVRAVAADAAAQGARYGAQSGAGAEAAERRTRDLLQSSLAGDCAVSARVDRRAGVPVVEVEVEVPIPLYPGSTKMKVKGHAPLE